MSNVHSSTLLDTLDDLFFVFDETGTALDWNQTAVTVTGYSTSDDGTGFGLAIVTEIAEAHGWDVRVTASDDGGARFEFTGVSPE